MKAEVIFATITGNNEDIADIITEDLEDHGIETKEEEISQIDPSEFKDVDICIVTPYTYDEGHLPEEGLDFFEDLGQLDLSNKIFGVAGSGDTAYGEFFCTAVDKFEEQFKKTGAIQGSKSLKINLEPDEKDIKDLDLFVENIINKIQN